MSERAASFDQETAGILAKKKNLEKRLALLRVINRNSLPSLVDRAAGQPIGILIPLPDVRTHTTLACMRAQVHPQKSI
jgi:hypothetical protein